MPKAEMARTRTSAAGISSNPGFTLIELVVVIALLAMAALLVFPRLPDTGTAALKGSARSIASTIRYLFDRGAETGRPYRLRFTIGSSEARVAEIRPDGVEIEPSDPFLSRRIIADGVTVTDLQTPRAGKTTAGEVALDFAPAGVAEPATIHLRGGDGGEMTVTVFPYGKRVTVVEGYRELAP